ncbi:M81 family metallopeptidase, partial [Escherichia coli]
LHGAMVTDFCQDGEGELLARLRAVVGPDLPIAITLDPPATVTRAMCDLAQIVLGYKTYPHVDMREIGAQAAGILHRTMAGEIRPRTLRVHRP